jgi:cysteinyl-tRNA synthetase
MDLIFPHHENEIAQSCGATGKEFARYWIHNGFVQINKEKMSKSLGNFFTIREIFEKSEWPEEVTGEILRYFLLSIHYHGPLDFSDQALKEAKQALDGFYDLFNRLSEAGQGSTDTNGDLQLAIGFAKETFNRGMDDDFNTPVALAAFQQLRGEINTLIRRGISTEVRKEAREEFRSLGRVFGLFQLDRWQFNLNVGREAGFSSDLEVQKMVDERTAAKKAKDFKRADAIRQALTAQGIIIEDKPDGTSRWKR